MDEAGTRNGQASESNGNTQQPQMQLPGDPESLNLHSGVYAQQQFAQNQALQEQLRKFWAEMAEEVDNVGTDPMEFKSQQLPLARIKKIMKSDEDVRMISAEAPVLFAKACEFFILELTLRSWAAAEASKRRTLQRSDAAVAISRTEIFDFLVDVVPQEEGAPGDVPGSSAMPAPPGATQGAPQQQLPPMFPPQFMGGGMMFQPGMFVPPFNQQQQFAMMAAAVQQQQQQQQQMASDQAKDEPKLE